MIQIDILKQIETTYGVKFVKQKLSEIKNLGSQHTYTINQNGHIVGIKMLDLNLKTIPPEIIFFKKLTHLNLRRNQIEDISLLKGLKSITSLDLTQNNISDISALSELKRLTYLSLAAQPLEDITALKDLTKITHLFLDSNKIKDISPLSKLVDLASLRLDQNQIENIEALKDLKKLYSLNLEKNSIKILPSWITDFNMEIHYSEYADINIIRLFGNPLITPPVEIVKSGKEDIIRYFEKIKEEGIDYIYEAKLTLVGEGNAGKTSLQVRLMNSKAALPRKDKRTRGIKIYDWNFKTIKGKNHIAHIWDFGGQDVYYPVHRFFLTENSVFVLLASTRQTHHNFDYWIPTIYQFGGKSPIILGQTCHEGNKVTWNDLGYYIANANFNIIKTQELPYFEINLPNKNEGLSKIKQTIINQIIDLQHYGKGVPSSWVSVRDFIAVELKKSDCITFEKFKEICKKSNAESFAKLIDIQDCAKFLHSIGVILWYYDNEELKNWVILQPEWAMNAVYKIIDDDEIQKRRGTILAKDFDRLWKDTCYEDKHAILKKMLEVFKIAFPKKHKKEEYIIPARLLSMPNDAKWLEKEPYLRLEYKYDFMPKGMVNQVSAELSRYIKSDDQIWNNAVNLIDDSTVECQVEEDFYNRKISIKAKGKDARGLIKIVMNALNDITDGYKGVKPEIFVPCTCSKCKTSHKPTQFLYDDLLRWAANEENAHVFCNEGRESLLIEKLLNNVGLRKPLKEETSKLGNKTITLFLASSSELEDDRKEFEIFINRENKRLNKRGVFIKLELWEDFIDAMSKTRLQDEYNTTIRNCDVFVSLFFTKVGKYTEEEFETAFGSYKETGKPVVYTYFKDANITTGKITKQINTLLKFQEKLKKLGHYKSNYNDIEGLKNKVKTQLEKLYPDF